MVTSFTKSNIFIGLASLGRLSPSPLQGHLYRLSLLSDGANWSVNAACQNMAAILNDPKRGKQKDFFTRTWGESFVETSAILPSPLLPNVDDSYFAPYLKKISKRYKKTNKKSASNLVGDNSKHIPSRLAGRHLGKYFYFIYFLKMYFKYF